MRNFLLFILAAVPLFAHAQQPATSLRNRTLLLRRFLEQNHYQPLPWDDSASARLYDRWLDILDDDKLVFSQQEVTQLNKYRYRLDEEMMGKEWAFFDQSLLLYRSALRRADSLINDLLQQPFDFSTADNLQWPLVEHPADNIALKQTWRRYFKWKILRAVSDMVTDTGKTAADRSKLPAGFARLEAKARAQVKKQELAWVNDKLADLDAPEKGLEDDYLSAIAWCYDPHTEYMNAAAKTDFDTEMSGLEFSAGFEMDENEKGEWVISYLVPGGPAWRNGELHQGDVLLRIKAGNKPELVVADASVDELNTVFTGNSTEKLTVTVRTVSGAQKTAILAKEKITNEQGVVKSYELRGPKKIGYISLPGFYVKEGDEDNTNGCSNDVAKEVVKLKKDSIAGLILDLRYNGGGSLGEALELAGIFISEGSITSTKDRTGKVHFLRDPNRGTIYDGPMLVMVNTMSASASELVTAVLQDYHRALIVGSPTYGKGSSQVILPLDTSGNAPADKKYDSYVKVTSGKFYRVDGSTTQWKGVLPDIALPDMYAMDKFREKGTVSALPPDNSKPAIYQPLAVIPVEELKTKSIARVTANKDFTAFQHFADWYKKMDDVRNIPLQWPGYVEYYDRITEMYRSVEATQEDNKPLVKITNNSLDAQNAQEKSFNEINIKRLEKDDYIAECYKIMQDWIH